MLPASMFHPEHLREYFPETYKTVYSIPMTTPTTPIGPAPPLYDIPHPAGAVSAVSPLVSPGLWKPYQQAEERLMDIYQSRGQLGAPGAGLSGAAAAGLGEFYQQAAKDIGLQTYQMGMPLWQAQLQRETMPWQMLPGLLGGAYPTGIAQDSGFNFGGALGGGLTGAGMGYLLSGGLGAGAGAATAAGAAAAPATGGASLLIPALMGAGGFLSGGK